MLTVLVSIQTCCHQLSISVFVCGTYACLCFLCGAIRARVQDKQRFLLLFFIIKCLQLILMGTKITRYELIPGSLLSLPLLLWLLGMTNREGEEERGVDGRREGRKDSVRRDIPVLNPVLLHWWQRQICLWLSAVSAFWQRTEARRGTNTHIHMDIHIHWTGLGGSHWCLAVSIRGVTQLFLQVWLQQLSPYGHWWNEKGEAEVVRRWEKSKEKYNNITTAQGHCRRMDGKLESKGCRDTNTQMDTEGRESMEGMRWKAEGESPNSMQEKMDDGGKREGWIEVHWRKEQERRSGRKRKKKKTWGRLKNMS